MFKKPQHLHASQTGNSETLDISHSRSNINPASHRIMGFFDTLMCQSNPQGKEQPNARTTTVANLVNIEKKRNGSVRGDGYSSKDLDFTMFKEAFIAKNNKIEVSCICSTPSSVTIISRDRRRLNLNIHLEREHPSRQGS
jgi:hypothetical protein